jgi:hypothetical protein
LTTGRASIDSQTVEEIVRRAEYFPIYLKYQAGRQEKFKHLTSEKKKKRKMETHFERKILTITP